MSIRELSERDLEWVNSFLQQDVSCSAFIIGDIFNYGFEKEFQQIWGDFDSHGELRAVLLRYYGNYLPYAPKEFDIDGFVEIIKKGKEIDVLSATEEMVDYFKTFPHLPLNWASKRRFHLAELNDRDLLPREIQLPYSIRRMQAEDVEKIVQLNNSIEEFNLGPLNVEALQRDLRTGSSRGYVIEHDNRFIGMARTTAENPYAAMLIGVGTDVNYRNQGIASALVTQLCQEVIREGKKVCLFYDNPEAGNIYKRLGFKDNGFWSVVKGENKEDIGN